MYMKTPISSNFPQPHWPILHLTQSLTLFLCCILAGRHHQHVADCCHHPTAADAPPRIHSNRTNTAPNTHTSPSSTPNSSYNGWIIWMYHQRRSQDSAKSGRKDCNLNRLDIFATTKSNLFFSAPFLCFYKAFLGPSSTLLPLVSVIICIP